MHSWRTVAFDPFWLQDRFLGSQCWKEMIILRLPKTSLLLFVTAFYSPLLLLSLGTALFNSINHLGAQHERCHTK